MLFLKKTQQYTLGRGFRRQCLSSHVSNYSSSSSAAASSPSPLSSQPLYSNNSAGNDKAIITIHDLQMLYQSIINGNSSDNQQIALCQLSCHTLASIDNCDDHGRETANEKLAAARTATLTTLNDFLTHTFTMLVKMMEAMIIIGDSEKSSG
jgi:hypothetical protein